MYTLRKAASENVGMAWLLEKTPVISPVGRLQLLETVMCTEDDNLNRIYDHTQRLLQLATDATGQKCIDNICCQLMCLRDISSTLNALKAGQTLGDIELYELKALALAASATQELMRESGIKDLAPMPDVEEVITLLDPEKTRVAHFYIYDTYSEKLQTLRSELRNAQANHTDNEAEIYAACSDEEAVIRQKLCTSLKPKAEDLHRCLRAMGHLDIMIARSRVASEYNLTRPQLTGDGHGFYIGLWNPAVKEALTKRGKNFQPIDIDIPDGATVITGANMAGKSVALKTVGMAQRMAQFGYYVPALKACIAPVESVMESIGDGQSEMEGMSSYAAEMQRIDFIIKKIRDGHKCLALIDEPARTTNPEEGKALVNAIIELLNTSTSSTLITTHYSGLTAKCHRLRVHGFREELAAGRELTPGSINDYIDYSLEPSDNTEAPHEALRIARLIGINPLVTETATRYLDQYNNTPDKDAEE